MWDLIAGRPASVVLLIAGTIHLTIGAIAANVAVRKGRNRSLWLPMGLIMGTPALIIALFMAKSEKS